MSASKREYEHHCLDEHKVHYGLKRILNFAEAFMDVSTSVGHSSRWKFMILTVQSVSRCFAFWQDALADLLRQIGTIVSTRISVV